MIVITLHHFASLICQPVWHTSVSTFFASPNLLREPASIYHLRLFLTLEKVTVSPMENGVSRFRPFPSKWDLDSAVYCPDFRFAPPKWPGP